MHYNYKTTSGDRDCFALVSRSRASRYTQLDSGDVDRTEETARVEGGSKHGATLKCVQGMCVNADWIGSGRIKYG